LRKSGSRPIVRNVSDSRRRGVQPCVSSLRENQTQNGRPQYQKRCLPGAGIRAASSPRRLVSRSNQRTRFRNFCSRNHSLIHSNAVSSSVTVSIIVVWQINHDHRRIGRERRYTPIAPTIISSNPPEANWFCPASVPFTNSKICFICFQPTDAVALKSPLSEKGISVVLRRAICPAHDRIV